MLNKSEIEILLPAEEITTISSVGGGCIASAAVINTRNKKYFVKRYSDKTGKITIREANGLKELAKPAVIKIPEVIFVDEKYLILEYVSEGSKNKNTMPEFGRQLARLHKFNSPRFGFSEDNFIGASPQKNTPVKENWAEFYWENRIKYQYRLAETNGYADSLLKNSLIKLENEVENILSGSEEKPSLIHGDLWSGNYLTDLDGKVVLIDPAVYYGHREAELAMTMLFGGFTSDFYQAYNEEFPLEKNWQFRMDIYKLYHIMNHLNLFGSGYYSQTINLIKKYI